MKKNLFQISFLSSTGVLFYISIVVLIIQNLDNLISNPNSYWGPIMFLMLFVFSALITALLILGYPLWLYLEGKKEDSIKLLFSTIGWLFIMLIMTLIANYYLMS